MAKYRSSGEFNELLGRQFRTETTKTFFTSTGSAEPIAISHIVLHAPMGSWTRTPEPEAAFALHVTMAPLPRFRVCVEGRHAEMTSLAPGDIFLFDLGTPPAALFRDPMESVRFHISQRTLDDLSRDRGHRRIAGLRPTLGQRDPILHALSRAALSWGDFYGPTNPLFLDRLALAFHAHIAEAYGQDHGASALRGGLAPWQLRRARELMMDNLAEGITTARLAEACGLSMSYFTYAFRTSTGMPPHKWLMKARVEHAKCLLRDGPMALRDIALTCGFSDQSHLSRVFALQEGMSPAQWRRFFQNAVVPCEPRRR